MKQDRRAQYRGPAVLSYPVLNRRYFRGKTSLVGIGNVENT